jgi:hypothetical protein
VLKPAEHLLPFFGRYLTIQVCTEQLKAIALGSI